jgi:hypothetical protein
VSASATETATTVMIDRDGKGIIAPECGEATELKAYFSSTQIMSIIGHQHRTIEQVQVGEAHAVLCPEPSLV